MKKTVILRILSLIISMKMIFFMEIQSNEQKNQMLLNDIKRNVINGKSYK